MKTAKSIKNKKQKTENDGLIVAIINIKIKENGCKNKKDKPKNKRQKEKVNKEKTTQKK